MDARDFYDKIAQSWYNVRHRTIFREELERMNGIWSGGKLLNIGCAHGPDFVSFDSKKFQFYGTDISKNLLLMAKKYSQKFDLTFHLTLSDMKNLPFGKSSFDYVICVATLHHLLDKGERLLALSEIKRVLKKEAFLTVWNRDNPELPNKEIIEREWHYRGEVFKRKYYLYTKEGLEKELKDAEFEIRKLGTGRGNKNIFAVVKSTKVIKLK